MKRTFVVNAKVLFSGRLQSKTVEQIHFFGYTKDNKDKRSEAMLYIITALYCEAKPLIKYFGLKKTDQFHKFQVFLAEDILVVITGVGEIATSVAISSVCSIVPPTQRDFFLSFGSAGAVSKALTLREIYLLHKITRLSTNQTFYPDVLFHHPFEEIQGVTGSKVLKEETRRLNDIRGMQEELFLYDMEGAASYMSASYFFGTHQMAFLRILSDYGEKKEQREWLTADQLTFMIEEKAHWLFPFIEQIKEQSQQKEPLLHTQEKEFIEKIEQLLHLSTSMKYILQQHLCYYLLLHDNLFDIIKWCDTQIPASCKSKREGKIYFEELKRQLL